MTVRQEENTPIGDYFHDSGLFSVFNMLSTAVDEFEVDTVQLNSWIDNLILNLKGLKTQIKKTEIEYQKFLNNQELKDRIKVGVD